MVAQGRVASRFAIELAKYTGLAQGVVTSSGSAAITLALRALRLPVKGEVIIPTYVCRSVGDAVVEAGLTPVLCDVGDSWNVTPQSVAPRMSVRTVAIIVPHVFGIVCDVDAFAHFGVPIIEDACQAFGRLNGEAIGARGTAGVFSFNATKCLTAGEGGYVVSRLPAVMQRMRDLAIGHDLEFSRFFSPMTDIQAALGISQLARYDEFLARRRYLADRYIEALVGTCVSLPTHVRDRNIFFRFPVLVKDVPFDETRTHFESRGVSVRRGVDALLHRTVNQPAIDFPIAERLFRDTVSLPLYPAMTDEEQDIVIAACLAIWSPK